MTLRLGDHCGQELARLADEDDRIWVLDGDLADSDGALHFARRHPQRFIMSGIAEQAMVSMAAGLASCGQRPWVFSFAAFLCYRAYDQIRVCLSQANQPVVLVGSHSGGCSARNGATHSALNDLALMTSLPNLTVWCPGDPGELRLAVRTIMGEGRPAYLRLPRRPLPDLPDLPDLPGTGASCRWLTEPASIALLGTGLGTHLALAAARELTRRGCRVGVAHCPRLVPLPRHDLAALTADVEYLFTVEDHYLEGGFGTLVRNAGLVPRMTAFGWPAHWTGQSGDDLAEGKCQ
jgi:transketolase